jgi:hypothetical protein
VGIATQDPELRKKFQGQPEHAINFFSSWPSSCANYGAAGLPKFNDGGAAWTCWTCAPPSITGKARGSTSPRSSTIRRRRRARPAPHPGAQDHGFPDKALDYQLIDHAREAIEHQTPVEIKLPIRNVHRTVGAMLSGEIARRYGSKASPTTPSASRLTARPARASGHFLPKA